MIIKEIKRIKRGHYAVMIDDKTIYASETMLSDYHLYKGKQLDDNWSFETFADDYNQRCCYQTAIRLVSRRDHFIKELIDKLKQRNFNCVAIDATIDKLQALGYINEAKYGAFLISQYQARDSKRQLYSRLLKKGCPPKLIDQLLSEIEIDELNNAVKQLNKKIKGLSAQQIIEKGDKLMYYLVRRGFDYAVAKQSYQTIVGQLNQQQL